MKTQKSEKQSNPAKMRRTIAFFVTNVVFTFSTGLYATAKWIGETFDISFEELLYTLTSPLKGASPNVVWDCVKASMPQIGVILLFVLINALLLFIRNRGAFLLSVRLYGWTNNIDLLGIPAICLALSAVAAFTCSLKYTYDVLHLADYIETRISSTTLYEDYYVSPSCVEITGGGKNLIYIYMESLETTYASESAGGRQQKNNYIPNLTTLARKNLSFSNSTQLGGFHPVKGTTWTMGSLFATTAGIPFSFPVEGNSMDKRQTFASGVTTLGDILLSKGYQNEFLCGSDGNFAGRADYFTQHGDYRIFDLHTARQKQYIPEDYEVWWGYEDEILYQIAKDELTTLAHSGQPFNLTMLTVDTHHVDGYVCGLCEGKYDSVTANVVSCADRQVLDFITWCQNQDFYKDTVIVITGDHPRMDTNLVENLEYDDRTVYNCFLNCGLPAHTKNREFTAMDIFPTVLAAMGFQIKGDRLGLGTNLFSEKPTLCESIGYAALNREIGKYSTYYVRHFA